MRKTMESLLALQKLQFDVRAQTAGSKVELEKLRAAVPPPILAHYERLAVRGKKGVALVRNGVCAECHLRLTGGKLIGLSAAPNEIHLCDNCGRYLYLPEAAGVGFTDPRNSPAAVVKKTSRAAAHHVA